MPSRQLQHQMQQKLKHTHLGKLRTSRQESQRFSTSPAGDLLAVRIGGRLPSAMQDNRGSAEEMRHNLYRQGK